MLVDREKCGKVPGMGSLTTTESFANGQNGFASNVTGDMNGVGCAMQVHTWGHSCPPWDQKTVKEECAKCQTHGYMLFEVSTVILPPINGCKSWFVRADMMARSALANARTRSLAERIDSCAKTCSKYKDPVPASDGGYSCLKEDGSYANSGNWYGTEDQAKTKCEADDKCSFLHDHGGDGDNWRACKSVAKGTGAVVKERYSCY